MATSVSKTRWNGSTSHDAHDDTVEVQLSYKGKAEKAEVLATQPTNLVCKYESENARSRLYFGDNLGILANLLHNPEVCGRIRLVYIDPPFATGGVFKSCTQEDAYSDIMSGSHYIEFIRKRLILLRELLADNGSIYVHLDSNMAFQIKIILDEVFGGKNFRNLITRKKCSSKNYTRKVYGNVADYILFYTKSDNYVWNRPFEIWTPEQIAKEYPYVEEETGRRYKKVPIHAPGIRNGATGKMWRGMLPPRGKHWQFTPDKLDKLDAQGEIFWSSNGNPRRKVYLDVSPGKSVHDIWLDYRDAHNQQIRITGYPTEKNPELLRRIINVSSNEHDLVLDCFAGSGTTLAVAEQLNRAWIGIDNSAHAVATTLKRFAIGVQPMGDFVSEREHANKTPEQPLATLFDLDAFDGAKDSSSSRGLVPHQEFVISRFSLFCAEPEQHHLDEPLSDWMKFLAATRKAD